MFSQLSLVIWEDVKDIFVRYLGWLSKIDFLKSKSQPHLWLFSYSMWLFSAFFFWSLNHWIIVATAHLLLILKKWHLTLYSIKFIVILRINCRMFVMSCFFQLTQPHVLLLFCITRGKNTETSHILGNCFTIEQHFNHTLLWNIV